MVRNYRGIIFQSLVDTSLALVPYIQNGEFKNANEAIREMVYKPQGFTNLKTLKQWNEEGYYVQKGSKGLPMWDDLAPCPTLEEIKNREAKPFLRVQYFFSEQQVLKSKRKDA